MKELELVVRGNDESGSKSSPVGGVVRLPVGFLTPELKLDKTSTSLSHECISSPVEVNVNPVFYCSFE